MTQYYIIEIREITEGEFEHFVYYAFDADPTTALLKAESKYHEVLSSAAISTFLHHSAIIIDSKCFPKMNYSYEHPVEDETEEVAE